MTSQLPRFGVFWLLAAEKDTENGAAVRSLRPFLFRDDYSRLCFRRFASYLVGSTL